MAGTIAVQPQNCNSHLHTACDPRSVENWEVCPFQYKNAFNDGIVPLAPQCSCVLCNLLSTISVESVILGMFNFLCGFIVGCSICQVTAPLSKHPTINCKPMSNFEMASVLCFTAKFLLDSPNRSYNKWKLLGRIHDQGNLASFFRYLPFGKDRTHFWPERRCHFYSLSSTSLGWSGLAPHLDSFTFHKTSANLLHSGWVTWFEMKITCPIYHFCSWFFVGAFYTESGLLWQVLVRNKCTFHLTLVC